MDRQQQQLDFEGGYRERMAVFRARLAAIEPASLGLSPYVWDQCREVLMAHFAFCDARRGRATVETATTLAGRAELSIAQFKRRRTALKELGILRSCYQEDRRGRLPDRWNIEHGVLERLVDSARCAKPPGRPAGRGPGSAGKEEPEVDDEISPTASEIRCAQVRSGEIRCAHYKETLNSRLLRRDGSTSGATKKSWDAATADEVRRRANAVARKLGRSNAEGDRSLVLKSCWLSIVRFGENWLWDAVEGCVAKKPKKPYAYLHKSLDTATRELGEVFARELALVDVPAELLKVPNRQTVGLPPYRLRTVDSPTRQRDPNPRS